MVRAKAGKNLMRWIYAGPPLHERNIYVMSWYHFPDKCCLGFGAFKGIPFAYLLAFILGGEHCCASSKEIEREEFPIWFFFRVFRILVPAKNPRDFKNGSVWKNRSILIIEWERVKLRKSRGTPEMRTEINSKYPSWRVNLISALCICEK